MAEAAGKSNIWLLNVTLVFFMSLLNCSWRAAISSYSYADSLSSTFKSIKVSWTSFIIRLHSLSKASYNNLIFSFSIFDQDKNTLTIWSLLLCFGFHFSLCWRVRSFYFFLLWLLWLRFDLNNLVGLSSRRWC